MLQLQMDDFFTGNYNSIGNINTVCVASAAMAVAKKMIYMKKEWLVGNSHQVLVAVKCITGEKD